MSNFGVKEKTTLMYKGERIYRWANQISYQAPGFDGVVNVFDVLVKKEQKLQRTRAFVSNLKLTEQNLERLEQVGQQRWKIENQGFDVQKNHGYALEHICSLHPNAM